MPSLRLRLVLLLFGSAMVISGACSDPKSKETFNLETGKHTTNWLPEGHATFAALAQSSGTSSTGSDCTACHGADLGGGISGVSCTHCHLGGTTSIHPLSWDPIYSTHGSSVNSGATPTASCSNQYCHGASLAGVSGSGPSCTSCHLGGPASIHPTSWDPIYLAHGPSVSSGLTSTSSCANQYCHGSSLQGVAGSGPACTSCHSYPYNPSSVTCGACHRIPPSGSSYPNIAGAHAKHATTNMASCDKCHSGASSYVGDHRNGIVDVLFATAYNPKSGGAPSYNSSSNTCSNLSCHGGPRVQTASQASTGTSSRSETPAWNGGRITLVSQCTACHVYGTLEYNSYSSGQHRFHVYNNRALIDCVRCHDVSKLAVYHFTSMGTASNTLLDEIRYSSNPRQCSPSNGGLTGCHDPQDDPRNW